MCSNSTIISCHIYGEQGPLYIKYKCIPLTFHRNTARAGTGTLHKHGLLHPEYWQEYIFFLMGSNGRWYGSIFNTVKHYTHSIIKCHLTGKKFSITISHKTFKRKQAALPKLLNIVNLRLTGSIQTQGKGSVIVLSLQRLFLVNFAFTWYSQMRDQEVSPRDLHRIPLGCLGNDDRERGRCEEGQLGKFLFHDRVPYYLRG